MQHELIYRGTLVQYWHAIFAELQRASRTNQFPQKPFRLSHSQPPKENETVAITFWDEQHRHEMVTVFADSVPDEAVVKSFLKMRHLKRWVRLLFRGGRKSKEIWKGTTI